MPPDMGQHVDKGKGKEMGKGKGLCKGEDVGKGKGKMEGQATPAPPQPHACSKISCLVRLRQKSLRHCLRSGALHRSLSDRPGRFLIAPGDQAKVRLWLAFACLRSPLACKNTGQRHSLRRYCN